MMCLCLLFLTRQNCFSSVHLSKKALLVFSFIVSLWYYYILYVYCSTATTPIWKKVLYCSNQVLSILYHVFSASWTFKCLAKANGAYSNLSSKRAKSPSNKGINYYYFSIINYSSLRNNNKLHKSLSSFLNIMYKQSVQVFYLLLNLFMKL